MWMLLGTIFIGMPIVILGMVVWERVEQNRSEFEADMQERGVELWKWRIKR